MKLPLIVCVTLAVLGSAEAANAQSYQTGQSVYAAPTGNKYWYSGCIVGSGRSNDSYQVECAGTTYWIGSDSISSSPPQAMADPMRPGQVMTPVITPSHPGAAAPGGGTAAMRRAPAAAPVQVAQAGGYAAEMHRRIQQDKVDAANAVLKNGKYSCYSGGQYTFSDLYITGPHSYTVKPGGSGSYSYANGALTFQSGPYAGAYSRMVDGHTVGVSANGSTNLGTQCGFDG